MVKPLALLLLALSANARACDEVDLTLSTVSWHSGKLADGGTYNGLNPGGGVRCGWGDLAVQGAAFRDSYRHLNAALLGEWTPLRVGSLHAGAFGGVAGYSRSEDPAAPFVAGLTARYQPGAFGALVRFVPGGWGKTSAVATLELSIRLR